MFKNDFYLKSLKHNLLWGSGGGGAGWVGSHFRLGHPLLIIKNGCFLNSMHVLSTLIG